MSDIDKDLIRQINSISLGVVRVPLWRRLWWMIRGH